MSYFHLPTSVERNPGQLETKLSDGRQLGAPDGQWTPELAALCGFTVIADTSRPADTATDTTTRTLAVTADTATVVWVARAKTPAEVAAAATAAVTATNTSLLDTRLRAAFDNNRTYLANAAPTAAQVGAQVKALTRQMNALIRATRFDLLADPVVD